MFKSDLTHPSQRLEEKLKALYGLARNLKIDLGFRPPFLALLEKLGNSHLSLPPVIHVAGTNGKGSTIAMLRAIIETHGKSAHIYTSPHLIKFNERIVLGGVQISDEALEPLIDEVLELNAGAEITFFEITTALAFAAFARSPADYCLLEVGLGGRLDSTNIVPPPTLSIIGRIGMDHMEFLGTSLGEIAAEKAGIMKADVPCVVGAQAPDAMEAIKARGAEIGAHLIMAEPWRADIPALPGAHQRYNAGLAVAAAQHLGLSERGIEQARWPARMQKLDYSPADGFELWLDGGHNADAGKAIAAQIEQWDDQPLYVVLGMMAHKDWQSFIGPIKPYADEIHVIDIPGEDGCLKAADISGATQGANLDSVLAALSEKQPGRILIAGSLYLAGHVLETLDSF